MGILPDGGNLVDTSYGNSYRETRLNALENMAKREVLDGFDEWSGSQQLERMVNL